LMAPIICNEDSSESASLKRTSAVDKVAEKP
jgi:hypothetical protein